MIVINSEQRKDTFSSDMMYILYRNILLKETNKETIAYINENYQSLKKKEVMIIKKCLKNKEEYIKIIEPLLVKWTYNRLPTIDKAILLLAIHFILNDIGDAIHIINDSIEMIKKYSEFANYAYINAVLDKIYKSIKNQKMEDEKNE